MSYECLKISGNLLTIAFHSTNQKKVLGGVRGAITDFSARAGSRMCGYLRSCVANYAYIVTLTYPAEPSTWYGHKEHFRALIERARRAGFLGKDVSWFWFLEFQGRGAPHFHFYSTHRIPKYWLSLNWYQIVNSGDQKHLAAGTNIEKLRSGRAGTIAYARKYAQKLEQKTVPDMFKSENLPERLGEGLKREGVGRFWGVVGVRARVEAATKIPPQDFNSGVVSEKLSELEKIISGCFEHKRVDYCNFSGVRCFFFKDERTARKIFAVINAIKKANLCQLDARRDQIGREGGSSLQRMRVVSSAKRYVKARDGQMWSEKFENV